MYKLPIQVLKDHKAPAIALLLVALSTFGLECVTWDPSILRAELEKDFELALTDLQSDRLQAAVLIYSAPSVVVDSWEAFETVANLLNNQHDTFEDISPLEAEDIATALAHIQLILQGTDHVYDFSSEVLAYVGIIFHNYGCCKAPDILSQAIMPVCNGNDSADVAKNQALHEIFEASNKWLKAYIDTIVLPK